jgi:hypothetical protein
MRLLSTQVSCQSPPRVELTYKSKVFTFGCRSHLQREVPSLGVVSEAERKRTGSLLSSYRCDARQGYGKTAVVGARTKGKSPHAGAKRRVAGSRGFFKSQIREFPESRTALGNRCERKSGNLKQLRHPSAPPLQANSASYVTGSCLRWARGCLAARVGCLRLLRIRTIRGYRGTSGPWRGCPLRSRPLLASRVRCGSSPR